MRHIFSIRILLLAAAATTLLLTSCGTGRKATVTERQEEYTEVITHVPKHRKEIIKEARTWLGTPYKYGEESKGVCTDCSGMVMHVFLAFDYHIPRNSAKQAEYCRKIRKEDAAPGDLVFFATGKDPEKVTHVGIVVDEESFIHASSSKGVVISKLTNPWYAKRLRMFGRLPQLEKLPGDKKSKSSSKSLRKKKRR